MKKFSLHQGNPILPYLHEHSEVHDEDQFLTLIATELSTETAGKIMTLAQLHQQRGAQRKSIEIAQNMLSKGLRPALVAETTGLDLCKVKEMADASQKTFPQRLSMVFRKYFGEKNGVDLRLRRKPHKPNDCCQNRKLEHTQC